MGKSTTADLCRQAGLPVYDADEAVHALYAPGGAAVDDVEAAFPGVAPYGGVDRSLLSQRLIDDPSGFSRLEAIVYPLLRVQRDAFVIAHAAADVVVFDIPLLFETGGEAQVDAVMLVTAPPQVQIARVMARPGMDEAKLKALLARQSPDAEKRARADFLIYTDQGLASAAQQLDRILKTVRAPDWRPAPPPGERRRENLGPTRLDAPAEPRQV
jgi:dephospho-CoA kinase